MRESYVCLALGSRSRCHDPVYVVDFNLEGAAVPAHLKLRGNAFDVELLPQRDEFIEVLREELREVLRVPSADEVHLALPDRGVRVEDLRPICVDLVELDLN